MTSEPSISSRLQVRLGGNLLGTAGGGVGGGWLSGGAIGELNIPEDGTVFVRERGAAWGAKLKKNAGRGEVRAHSSCSDRTMGEYVYREQNPGTEVNFVTAVGSTSFA